MKTIAEFSIKYYQYIDKDGKAIAPLPEFAKDATTLRELYRYMVLIRTFDAKAVALQRTGKMGTFPSSLGQEAISVGVGHSMHKTDVLCPYYRDQGAMFIRGVKLSEILNYWGGDERGSDFAGPREDFPISVPIATQCLHAAGVAYAFRYRKQNRVVVTTVGDGGTSKGDFYEAMNLAGEWQLPVVFIINNNQWAISVPLAKQTHAKTLAQKAIAAGIEGLQVDGNDVIAVKTLTDQALEKARNGGGPTVIEAISYRLCDHTTADDAKRYCHPDELKQAWQYEPIARLRTYMYSQKMWSEEQEEQLLKQCTDEVEQAVTDYLNIPPQSPTAIVDYMFAKWPENLKEQREELGAIKNA